MRASRSGTPCTARKARARSRPAFSRGTRIFPQLRVPDALQRAGVAGQGAHAALSGEPCRRQPRQGVDQFGRAARQGRALARGLEFGWSGKSRLLRYDAVRRPRAQAVARAARRAGLLGHRLTLPPAVFLRNRALRLAPSGAVVRAVLAHADWTPPRLPPAPGGAGGDAHSERSSTAGDSTQSAT